VLRRRRARALNTVAIERASGTTVAATRRGFQQPDFPSSGRSASRAGAIPPSRSDLAGRDLLNIFTGNRFRAAESLLVAELLHAFPVALIVPV
jgi:hypothetical protein